jgi:hypothetical protein
VGRHGYVEAPQTQIRGANLNEQAFDRLDSGAQIPKTLQHQVTARRASSACSSMGRS